MPEVTTTSVTNAQKNCDTVKVSTITEGSVTKTTTNNCSKACNESITVSPEPNSILTACCPCGRFDLDKLAEESRRCAFKSSNIVLATSNSIVVFTLLVLQEILKNQCRSHRLNLDTVFLIASAMATVGEGIRVNNPPPFNS